MFGLRKSKYQLKIWTAAQRIPINWFGKAVRESNVKAVRWVFVKSESAAFHNSE